MIFTYWQPSRSALIILADSISGVTGTTGLDFIPEIVAPFCEDRRYCKKWLEPVEYWYAGRSESAREAATVAISALSKAMRFLARTFLLLLIALPILAIIAVWLCFHDAPLVVRDVRLTPQDIERAKRVIAQHDPRKARSVGARNIAISEQDLDLMLNYAASRFGKGAARATLGSGTMRLQASAEIPQSPFGRYLNVDAALRETGALPRFDSLKIGRLPVPAIVGDYALREGVRRLMATDHGELFANVVKDARIANGRLTVTYVWSREIEERARTVLLTPTDQARLRAYHDRLVEAVAKAPSKISLAELMPPLFRSALVRGGSGDIRPENRAAIVVLAFYANGTSLAVIAPAAAQWPRAARRTLTLAGRDDFPKHFLISAAIAAAAGSPLADAIGLQKEIEDSRGGSGFSFNDIGADRAGTRFGEVASQSPDRARALAQAIAGGVKERDFMPDVADLPEFMPEAEFKRRYGGIGGPRYREMMATIEARVASRPLLR